MREPSKRFVKLALLGAFLAAVGFTGFHILRSVQEATYWRHHRDEPIQGWMTVGFVAHSYHVPPHVLLMALGLPLGPPPDKRPIAAIARAQGRSLTAVVTLMQNAIVHARPPYPPPAPPPTNGQP